MRSILLGRYHYHGTQMTSNKDQISRSKRSLLRLTAAAKIASDKQRFLQRRLAFMRASHAAYRRRLLDKPEEKK